MEEKEINNRKKVLAIFIVAIIVIVAILVAIYCLKDKKEPDNGSGNNNNNNNNNTSGIVYKTSDGKFTLKIVDKNDENAAADFKKTMSEEELDTYKNDIKYYAYFNNTIMIVIDTYKEDEHYLVYSFGGYPNAEAVGYTLVINKDTNKLEINPEELNGKESTCMERNFCNFSHQMSFIKTELGYFFIDESYGEYTLYTTSWKKLGFVYVEDDKLKEIDSTGVIAYHDRESIECFGNECTWNLLIPEKYDINGNVVSN